MQTRHRFLISAAILAIAGALAAAPAKAPKAKAPKPAKPAAAAPAAVRALHLAPGASLKILGDSTLHKWEARATSLTITGELSKAGEPLAAATDQGLSKLALATLVTGLKSGEGSSMDKNMHKALEAEQFAEITFNLKGYELKGGAVTAKGDLSIHGVSKAVELPGTVSAKDGGLAVKGSYPLKMSDYGVKPPVMMMGTVRVKDEVTIDYDFVLVP
jgi:polyisoprenoid-binding protein YceI